MSLHSLHAYSRRSATISAAAIAAIVGLQAGAAWEARGSEQPEQVTKSSGKSVRKTKTTTTTTTTTTTETAPTEPTAEPTFDSTIIHTTNPPPPPAPEEPLAFPILAPDNGFAGPTPQPAAVGTPDQPGYDAKAIARWDVVPFQTFTGDFNVGVVAFHMNGIDRVEFSVNGGAWTPVTEMQLNPQTGVWEYTATLRAGDFADGPVEVRAIAWPKVGIPRLLGVALVGSLGNGEQALALTANAGGTLPTLSRYVATTGSDLTGDGSEANPFATMMKAARSIQNAQGSNADGGVIYLKAGEYTYGTYSYELKATTSQRWLTVMPAPGLTKQDVTILKSGSSGLRTKLVHLADLTIRGVISTTTPDEDYLWIDNCHLVGVGRTTSIAFASASAWSGVFATDSTLEQNRDGLVACRIQRNVRVSNIGSDAFTNSAMVLNCSVDGIDKSGTDFHPDVYQFSGTGTSRENVIVYGMQAFRAGAQGIFADDLASLANIAFVNVVIQKVGPYENPYFSQWQVPTDHLLFWNVTNTHRFCFRTDALTNLSVVGCVFPQATAPGTIDQRGFRSNHFIDATSYGMVALGSEFTTGDAMYCDPSSGDFRPAPGSPLRYRLSTSLVPADAAGVPLDTPSAIGALQPAGQ
jgi:hypothetical protein